MKAFSNEEAVIKHPAIAVKVHRAIERDGKDIDEASRKAWILSAERAKNYKLLMAVVHGVIEEVYEVKGVERSLEGEDRVEFKLVRADQELRRYYRGKRLPEKYQVRRPAIYLQPEG